MKFTASEILARWRVAAFALVVLGAGAIQAYQLTHNKGYMPNQPIPFSHKLHAGDLGMDCLYCHTTATKSKHSSVPSMETCMGCHSVVRTDSEHIQKLTDYYNRNEPIPWVRIHSLPDHAYFNHSQHINAGVACQECHGPVQEMEIVYQHVDLSMGWCMSCHRSDEYLRTPERIMAQELQNQFAHSFYHLGEAPRVSQEELDARFESVTHRFRTRDDLNQFTEVEGMTPEEVGVLITEALGYHSLANQEGRRGAASTHVRAFQNANISCNTCHY